MYNEYKASEGKVLFNTKSMSWGNIICSAQDLTPYLFECDKEIAKQYKEQYDAYMYEQMQQNDMKKVDQSIVRDMTPKVRLLSTEETVEDKMIDKRQQIISEMLANGVLRNTNINVIKHE